MVCIFDFMLSLVFTMIEIDKIIMTLSLSLLYLCLLYVNERYVIIIARIIREICVSVTTVLS